MSKTRIAITTLFIAVLAALGISMPAMAATVNEGATTPVPFTHTMHANPATDLAGITYTIGIAGTAADGTTGSYASTAVDVIGAPFTEGTITPATPSPAVRSDSTESTKIWADTETLAALFGSDDPTNTDAASGYPKFASNFPQAGIYKFTISETRAGADSAKWSYTPESDGIYTLTVWIENNQDDITKRHYDGWVLTAPSGSKVDVNATAGSEAGADFTSTYTATTSLNVTKQVAGEYASTTHAFPQEITLTLPDWAADADNITATGGQSGQWTTSTGVHRTYTVNLAHGDTVSFSNLPVGTRYGVHETSQTDAAGLSYSAGMEWTVDDGGVTVPINKVPLAANAGGSFKLTLPDNTTEVSSAKAGDEIHVVSTPDEDYEVLKVSATGVDSQTALEVDTNADKTIGSFTVPEEPVEVEVDFANHAGAAYAVLDGDGKLTLFRSENRYADNTTVTDAVDVSGNTYSGTIFAYIETRTGGFYVSNSPWYDSRESIKDVAIPEGQIIKPKTCVGWFAYCNITSFSLPGLDTSECTSMRLMFMGSTALVSADLSNFNTSKVTDMTKMFGACRSLTSLDLSSFDTSQVTSMERMFEGCSGLSSINVSSFNTSKVRNMEYMFYGFTLSSLDVSNFNTSNVTSMSYMFSQCPNLTSLDLSNFDTSEVTNMSYMFRYSGYISLDLSSFDTSKVTDTRVMFQGCSELETIYASADADWNTDTLSSSSAMFERCDKLKGGNGSTRLNSNDKTYARVDGLDGQPGYFTAKS